MLFREILSFLSRDRRIDILPSIFQHVENTHKYEGSADTLLCLVGFFFLFEFRARPFPREK